MLIVWQLRLLGKGITVPVFAMHIAGWLNMDKPPLGIHLMELGNSGHLPGLDTSYMWHHVEKYANTWWMSENDEVIISPTWVSTEQESFNVFKEQVCNAAEKVLFLCTSLTFQLSVLPPYNYNPVPVMSVENETKKEILQEMIYEVSNILDMAKDGMVGCVEDLEVSNAMLQLYDTVIVKEASTQLACNSPTVSIISVHSLSAKDSEEITSGELDISKDKSVRATLLSMQTVHDTCKGKPK